ncbi:MAG: cytochrome B6 [Cytophagaceae bacterium]|nr:MAG: cytochrome B6 [Cytophagaceae bacterium]
MQKVTSQLLLKKARVCLRPVLAVLLIVCIVQVPASRATDINKNWKTPFANIGTDTSAFSPLPSPFSVDQKKADLGRRLFFDPRMSADNSISCAHCHLPNQGGATHEQFCAGVKGALGSINAPTILNAALNFRQMWNGRLQTLEEQVDRAVTNPKELGTRWEDITKKLSGDLKMLDAFRASYDSAPSAATISDAIAQYERTLLTPNSPFDLYLKGDSHALSPTQLRGFQKFKAYGCSACHQGFNVGGNMFQRLGVAGDYFKDRGKQYDSDVGRLGVTGKEADRHVFRVPSLRNVELTSPYFHDGLRRPCPGGL